MQHKFVYLLEISKLKSFLKTDQSFLSLNILSNHDSK